MNRSIITSPGQDPLGNMLLDYWAGRERASLEVESTTMEMWTMTGAVMFRDFAAMDALERTALRLCQGRILDVGAGSGCHSLVLQSDGAAVEAIDISPGCVEVMRKRGVASVSRRNLFQLEGEWDTLLMMMNGIGICGSLEGCHLLLQFARSLLAEGGQIIADSTDIALISGGEEYWPDGGYLGETEFVMKYGDCVSEPFPWLYIDFERLRRLADSCGFRSEKIAEEKNGRYLARLAR